MARTRSQVAALRKKSAPAAPKKKKSVSRSRSFRKGKGKAKKTIPNADAWRKFAGKDERVTVANAIGKQAKSGKKGSQERNTMVMRVLADLFRNKQNVTAKNAQAALVNVKQARTAYRPLTKIRPRFRKKQYPEGTLKMTGATVKRSLRRIATRMAQNDVETEGDRLACSKPPTAYSMFFQEYIGDAYEVLKENAEESGEDMQKEYRALVKDAGPAWKALSKAKKAVYAKKAQELGEERSDEILRVRKKRKEYYQKLRKEHNRILLKFIYASKLVEDRKLYDGASREQFMDHLVGLELRRKGAGVRAVKRLNKRVLRMEVARIERNAAKAAKKAAKAAAASAKRVANQIRNAPKKVAKRDAAKAKAAEKSAKAAKRAAAKASRDAAAAAKRVANQTRNASKKVAKRNASKANAAKKARSKSKSVSKSRSPSASSNKPAVRRSARLQPKKTNAVKNKKARSKSKSVSKSRSRSATSNKAAVRRGTRKRKATRRFSPETSRASEMIAYMLNQPLV